MRGTGGGPEKTILLGASRCDPKACDLTVCYLRDARDEVFAMDGQAEALGVSYVEILERHSFDSSIWTRLRALVRDRRIEIVHAHEYKTDLLAWLLARLEGTTALATVHGWTGSSGRERWLYYPVDKRLLSRFPKLIAVSTQIRAELVRAGVKPNRIATVLNGIDTVAFRRTPSERGRVRACLGIAPDEVVVASVGRLEAQKRFDLLLESFASVRRHLPDRNLILIIAGEGTERNALLALADRLGIGARCRLLGHRTDIVSLHHAFDVFVQSSGYEGTPNAVLEAMALETPVVATSVGGTSELIRDEIEGLLVPPGDMIALSAAIERTIAESGGTSRRVELARKRVESDFSFDRRTRTVEGIYRELALKSRSAAAT